MGAILTLPPSLPEHMAASFESVPANEHGVFSSVELRAWNQVLPESTPGPIDQALATEVAKAQ